MAQPISEESVFVLQLPLLWTSEEVIALGAQHGYALNDAAIQNVRSRARVDPTLFDRVGLPRLATPKWQPTRTCAPFTRYVMFQDPALPPGAVLQNAKRLGIPGAESARQVMATRAALKPKKQGVFGGAPIAPVDLAPDYLPEQEKPMGAKQLNEMRSRCDIGDEVLVQQRDPDGRPGAVRRALVVDKQHTFAVVKFEGKGGAKAVHFKYIQPVPKEPAHPTDLDPKLDTLRAVPPALQALKQVPAPDAPPPKPAPAPAQPVVARRSWDEDHEVHEANGNGLSRVATGPRVTTIPASPPPAQPAPPALPEYREVTLQQSVTYRNPAPAANGGTSHLSTSPLSWLELAPIEEMRADRQRLIDEASALALQYKQKMEMAQQLGQQIEGLIAMRDQFANLLQPGSPAP